MSFIPQFARWLGRRGQRRRLTPIRRVRYRPALEALETRNLLSTLTVTNVLDTGVSGDGSLRGEIAAAASGDQIVFADSLAGQTITLEAANGPLVLSNDLTIQGPGADRLMVSGNNASRVFEVAPTFTEAISGLTIASGRVTDANGGGIFNAGTLTLTDCLLSGNSTSAVFVPNGYGGAIFNTGTLTVTNSRLSGNSAKNGGGGIYNFYSGTLTVTSSTLSGNSTGAYGHGGGIINYGTLAIMASTLSGNSTGAYGIGGGIDSQGPLTITNSTLSGNSASNDGGIINYGTLAIMASTLSGNSATNGGGGIDNTGGTVTLTNSTLSGNFAGGEAAGIYNSGTLAIMSSTVSGNSASAGGGIGNSGTLTVINSTISGNTASGSQTAGGIANISWFLGDYATVQLLNTTISGNTATSTDQTGNQLFTDVLSSMGSAVIQFRNTIIAGDGSRPDFCSVGGGRFTSMGHNLVRDSTGGSGFVDTDLVGTADHPIDPLLGPLQDNGGPTPTMALLAGSPALNAGDPAQLGVADQRGVVRSAGVNIGAYQASASAFVLTAPATATAGTAFDLTVQAVDPFGQTAVGYTGTVTFSSSDGQAVLPGDYTFTAADAGVHLFAGGATLLSAGSQTVTASDTGTGALIGCAAIWVTPAAADHLLFLQGPADTAAGQTLGPVVVAVVDPFGNVVTGDNGDAVTLSLGVNPAGGTLSGTLTVTVTNGVATFSDLSIDLAGAGYALHATSGGSLPDIDSNPFTVT